MIIQNGWELYFPSETLTVDTVDGNSEALYGACFMLLYLKSNNGRFFITEADHVTAA